jgi:dipeptidyl aminopeptidase/acylaminoacyl peptidase
LWIAETGLQKSARKLTNGSYNDRMPQWSPDGRSIAFLSDRGKQGKAYAIYLLELDANEPKAVTQAENERRILKFEFSPDGKHIAFVSYPEKSPEVRAREEAKDDAFVWGQDWEYANLYLLSTEKRTIKPLFKNAHVTDFAWNDDGTEIAIVTHRTPHIESKYLHGATISTLQTASREVTKICHVPTGVSSVTWSGSALYFLMNNTPEQDTSGLAVYSVNLFAEEYIYEKVAQGEENCASGLAKVNRDILVYVEQGLEDQLRLLDGKILFRQEKRIIEFDAVSNGDRNGMMLAIAQGDLNNPTEVFSITASDEITQLSDHGNTFAGKNFGNCAFIECQTLDNKERLDGLYLIPTQHASLDGKSKKPLPTIVLIHGGPYCRITDAFDVWDPLHLLVPSLLAEG